MTEEEQRDLLARFLRWLVDEGYAAERMLMYDATAGDIAYRFLDRVPPTRPLPQPHRDSP